MDGQLVPVSEIHVANGAACGRHPSRKGRLGRHRRQPADDGKARIHQHRLLVAQRVRVQRLVAGVERVGDGRNGVGSRPVDIVERHLDFEDLLAVAHVRAPAASDFALECGLGKPRTTLRLHLAVECIHTARVERTRVSDVRAHHLVAQVAREHPPGREHRREPRHHHARQAQGARDRGHVDARRASERQQRKAPRIDAATDRDEPDSFRHVGVDDTVNSLCRLHAADAETRRDGVHRTGGGLRIEALPAAEKSPWIEEPEHQVGVRHRR